MKCLDVPYFKQETLYTCGPASLRMTFAYFGIEIDEETLSKELGTNDATGTEREKMGEAVKARKLIPHERTDAALNDLRHLLDQNVPTIVRFFALTNDEDHYGVVIGMNDKQLVLHDPLSGSAMTYDLADFYLRWPCQYVRGQTCWLLGVGPESL